MRCGIADVGGSSYIQLHPGDGAHMGVIDLTRAMDDTITALEGWSDGTLDGLAVTTALQEAESALRATRSRLHVEYHR